MHKVFFLIVFSIFFRGLIQAQESPVEYKTPEEGFKLMQQHAVDLNYAASKQIGYQLLEEHPKYHDVSLYLARIYGWESAYDSAYAILDEVLLADSTLIEARVVRVDLAYWANDWEKLEQYCADALNRDSTLTDVKEKCLLAKQQGVNAQEDVELLVAYSFDHFSKPYVRNWHMLTVGALIPTNWATLMPYVNAGFHPGIEGASTDIQFNLDAYFNLGSKTYAMAGYGFSPPGAINFLPTHRAALEVWQVLPAGFGVSGGLRYFYWTEHFTFFTLSGEKYMGDYWISLRTYLFFKEYGMSSSWYLSGRKYLAGKKDYLSATIGFGAAPDEPLVVVSDLDRLNALSFRVGLSKQLNDRLRLGSSLGYSYEEYEDQAYRNRYYFRTGLYIRLQK